MCGSRAPAVSLFTEFLENDLGFIDVTDIEPEEIRILCEDEVFRRVADYCYKSRHLRTGSPDDGSFDRDELGVDPEEDYEDATTDV